MRFCWWIVEFEYRGHKKYIENSGHPWGWPVFTGSYSVFTTSAEKAVGAAAILPGFIRVLTCRGTWAPLEKILLINYQPAQEIF
jgi:hypothetical protein